MKILLTGATGFIGKRVLELLQEQYSDAEIQVLSGSEPQHSDTIRYISSRNYAFDADYLCSMDADAEMMIHMGAFIPKSGSEADDIEASTGNIRSTASLLAAAGKCSYLKKCIFISTVDVYSAATDALSESALTVPQTMYGWSKLYCEQMVKAFAQQHGIGYEILRLGHVYGEGEEKYRKVMPVMVRNAVDGNDITIYGDGEALRTFIYIDDVAQAIINAMTHAESETINVVGNEAVTINALASMIVRLSGAGSRIQIKHCPSDFPNRNLVFDNTRLMTTLLTELVPLETGLAREIAYIRKQRL